MCVCVSYLSTSEPRARTHTHTHTHTAAPKKEEKRQGRRNKWFLVSFAHSYLSREFQVVTTLHSCFVQFLEKTGNPVRREKVKLFLERLGVETGSQMKDRIKLQVRTTVLVAFKGSAQYCLCFSLSLFLFLFLFLGAVVFDSISPFFKELNKES